MRWACQSTTRIQGKVRRSKNGIVRPLTFRIRKAADAGGRPLEAVDYELGMIEGATLTAALGKSQPGGGHANCGVLSPDSEYSTVRAKLLELGPRLVKP